MKKIKILIGFIIPDIGGIIFNIVPMFLVLSLTNFFAGETRGYPPLFIAALLLISLGLLIIPFRLIVILAQTLFMNLNRCGIFSFAIIGGLTGGSIFYFLILSHFYLNWANMLNYALLGVFQSIVVQSIYIIIPDKWKIQLPE